MIFAYIWDMKPRLIHLFLTLALLLGSVAAFGQGKVYTRKVRLGDFPTRTVKVVAEGNSFLALALREEVAVHWRISPYEFCTQAEYDALRSSNNYYFLSLAREGGIAYLILTKGGRDDEKESLKKPFEVVRMPIAAADDPSGQELIFLGAFLDIIQAFVEEAMVSDKTAYGGLSAVNGASLKDRKVYLDPDAVDQALPRAESGTVVGLAIAPLQIDFNSVCYKMLISADTHELLYYKKIRYKGPRDARFTDAEIKSFERRGAILSSGN